MSTELIYSDATKLAELIRTREVSPVEVMKAHLDRIEAVNPRMNAIVTVAEDALKSAKKAETAVLNGENWPPSTVFRSRQRIRLTPQGCRRSVVRRSSEDASPIPMRPALRA